mgnify:FL=1|jgi:hypothetical protein|tara:strand:+ start:675 stop:1010 length:336 start_codon:yes stop_codon:yes gene_type:complete
MMFAVVRHTYQLDIPDPKNVFSTKSSAKWVHLVWVFDTEIDALSFAISLLDDPLIIANEWLLESAIHQLEENRFYQVGRESVAIAEVQESPEIVYEDKENKKEGDDEESIH